MPCVKGVSKELQGKTSLIVYWRLSERNQTKPRVHFTTAGEREQVSCHVTVNITRLATSRPFQRRNQQARENYWKELLESLHYYHKSNLRSYPPSYI